MIVSALEEFWSDARAREPALPTEVPGAWAFGATPDHADDLLALVLAGTTTGTASALWEIESEGEAVPEIGELSIVLDGRGHPRAVIITTTVEIVPFAQVSAEHAYAEGEGDRTLAQWRETHESFWRLHGTGSWAFSADMPIVCERFRVVFAGSDSAAANRPDSPSNRFWNGVP